MLPTFIGIGPGRTGTSMVYEALRTHPEVRMARGTKETNFFSQEYDRGLAWYKAFFEDRARMKAVGEISNTYFYDVDVPERIWSVVPRVKLFTCLRHPFDRLRSVYYYRQRAGRLSPDVTLEEALHKHDDLIYDNCYATKLRAYYEYFAQDQVLILLYDDLVAHPEAFMKHLFRFIGADPSFMPEVVGKHVNASARARNSWLAILASASARSLRRFGLLSVLDWAKRTRWVRRIILKPIAIEASDPHLRLSPAMQRTLLQLWTPEVKQLEQWTGRTLDHWLHP